MDNPLTLQEAKDQVAKKRGWSGYNEALVIGTEDDLLYINNKAYELRFKTWCDQLIEEAVNCPYTDPEARRVYLLEKLKKITQDG